MCNFKPAPGAMTRDCVASPWAVVARPVELIGSALVMAGLAVKVASDRMMSRRASLLDQIMHDIRAIREKPDAFDEGLRRRGLAPRAESLIALDEKRRAAILSLQSAQERRNAVSKQIGLAMARKDTVAAADYRAEVAGLKATMPELEASEREAGAALETELAAIPNLPLDDTPDGKDENDNVEIRRHGAPPDLGGMNKPREHFEIGEALGLMDFDVAAKLSGARFVVLKGALARLERALEQFMLDLHTTEHGYTEIAPPVLVRDAAMFGTAQLPKFKDDQFSAIAKLDFDEAFDRAAAFKTDEEQAFEFDQRNTGSSPPPKCR